MGVCPDTTRTPLPCLSLGCRPLSILGPWEWGGEGGVRVPGQRREDDRKEQTLRESSPEEGTYPLIPVGAVRVRKGAEASDGASS